MPKPRQDVRDAALEMPRRGDHGLSAEGVYESDVARRGAYAAAERELREQTGCGYETSRSALSWALAQARGDAWAGSGRKPGRTSGTRQNFGIIFPPDVLAYLHAQEPGRRSGIVIAAMRDYMQKAGD